MCTLCVGNRISKNAFCIYVGFNISYYRHIAFSIESNIYFKVQIGNIFDGIACIPTVGEHVSLKQKQQLTLLFNPVAIDRQYTLLANMLNVLVFFV